ncbi:sugar ABC transporter [Natronospirillum operosum]|uniref:Sugar ABC transporter n=2 Tax=Natronospirillum operosum TaxID=2759953 RepID=A0A4Z0WD14_9GAMM|nr:sugar ABC transporter [Natronospirillum operosum]
MVSHIGANDINARWFDASLAEFERRFPEVKTEYIATSEVSTQRYIQLIEQAIATNPDGLAVAITDAPALEGAIQRAIDAGIPVVAFNTPDLRDADEKIPYVTYVGTDLYLDGLHMAEYILRRAEAGEIDMPNRVLCNNPDAGHSGLVARCQGMIDGMAEAGIDTEVLTTAWDPAQARNILGSFLARNDDINYIFGPAGDQGPVIHGVTEELGRDDVYIVTTDASSQHVSGVQLGNMLASTSQGFWLQGYETMNWLFWKVHYGFEPASDILTGPSIIDASNVDQWEQVLRQVFGDSGYEEMITW